MEKLYRKIEIVSNILIIVATFAIVTVVVKGYVLPNKHGNHLAAPKSLVGLNANLSNVNWKGADKTLLLIVKKGCPFCAESAPFYQQLVNTINNKNNVHIIAVLPQELEESKQYLNQLNVQIQDIRQASLDSIGVAGVPTLALVDKNGIITDTWLGKLSTEQELEVLEKIKK